MIIEQIRYYVADDRREQVVEVRREVNQIRSQLGLPPGHILVADAAPEGAPGVIWQCGYEDEGQLGAAEAALIGHTGYEDARGRLQEIVARIELELYEADEEG